MILLDIGEKRGLQRGVGEFVHAESTEERVGTHAGDEVGTTGDDAGLRSAKEFVAAVGNDIDACAKAIEHARFAVDAD